LYTSCVLWVAPLCAFFNIFYLSKKTFFRLPQTSQTKANGIAIHHPIHNQKHQQAHKEKQQ